VFLLPFVMHVRNRAVFATRTIREGTPLFIFINFFPRPLSAVAFDRIKLIIFPHPLLHSTIIIIILFHRPLLLSIAGRYLLFSHGLPAPSMAGFIIFSAAVHWRYFSISSSSS
jgi:hypothetical protein